MDFVEWGGMGNGRENIAVRAGIWAAGDVVPSVAEGHSIAYDGDGDDASDWSDQGAPGLGQPPGGEEEPIAVETTVWGAIKVLFERAPR